MVDVHVRTSAGRLASLAIALVGLAVSVYLTIEHYDSSVTLACPESSTINCAKVTTSSWSKIGPIPVALLGTIFFALMAAACTPAALRRSSLDRVRIAGAVAGVLGALYFVWIELFKLDAICLWCTVVHLCSVALLGTVLWQAYSPPPGPEQPR